MEDAGQTSFTFKDGNENHYHPLVVLLIFHFIKWIIHTHTRIYNKDSIIDILSVQSTSFNTFLMLYWHHHLPSLEFLSPFQNETLYSLNNFSFSLWTGSPAITILYPFLCTWILQPPNAMEPSLFCDWFISLGLIASHSFLQKYV